MECCFNFRKWIHLTSDPLLNCLTFRHLYLVLDFMQSYVWATGRSDSRKCTRSTGNICDQQEVSREKSVNRYFKID